MSFLGRMFRESFRGKEVEYVANFYPTNPRKLVPKGCKVIETQGHRIVFLNKENRNRKLRNLGISPLSI